MNSSSFCTQDQSILLPHPVRLLKFVKVEWYNIFHIKIIKIYSNQVRQASSVSSPPLCHRQNLSRCTNTAPRQSKYV